MESYYLDWANLLLRWVHVITAIAWIGASFYFVMLDNSLEKPQDQESLDKGVGGEQWRSSCSPRGSRASCSRAAPPSCWWAR